MKTTTVHHYENFPVASWLCPARLRAPISAIYHFARTADDLADEGTPSADQRLRDLSDFRSDLHAVSQGLRPTAQWLSVFEPLAQVIAQWELPIAPLHALLDAFEQDVRMTAAARRYQDDSELIDYCAKSANPIGRMLLHLYGVDDETSLSQSDHICTALQLINFWQDLRLDLSRGRVYPSVQTMERFEVSLSALEPQSTSRGAAAMLRAYVDDARKRMLLGAPLAKHLRGRIGWELRAVVQGGLRIAQKIEQIEYATWQTRPILKALDWPPIFWRSLRMP